MTEMTWEDPPARFAGNNLGRHNELARISAELIAHPGKWAVIKVCPTMSAAHSLAYQLREGRVSSFKPAGAYEAISVEQDGEFRVYGRYIGEATP